MALLFLHKKIDSYWQTRCFISTRVTGGGQQKVAADQQDSGLA
jgi:hypothetical protein